MLPSIDDFIMARATAMAEHDGEQLSIVHIMGAASLLQGEIISARDRLLAKPAGSAHEPDIAEPSAPLDQGSAPVPAPDGDDAALDAPVSAPEEPAAAPEAEGPVPAQEDEQ